MTELHPILDIKSRVSIAAHVRYQMMERFVPTPGGGDSKRRGQRGADDLLTTPRLPFQQIVTAVAMTRVEHADGNIEPLERMTLSNPVLDEREIIEGLFAVIASLPVGESELVMFGGANHDMPLLVVRAMSYGLTSPKGWDWSVRQSRQGTAPRPAAGRDRRVQAQGDPHGRTRGTARRAGQGELRGVVDGPPHQG